MLPYTLESFLAETEAAIAASTDPKLVTDGVAEGLRRLIAAPFFLEERHQQPSPDGIARHELYRQPGGRFQVVAVVWSPKQATPIHDHSAWGIVAGLTNRIIATTYRRLDDGATPGFASLSESSRALISEQSFHFLRPGEEVVHKLENPFPDPAVTLHVFGGESGEQNYYDTRAKSLMTITGAWTLGL